MVTFRDDFDRANADLDGSNSWQVIGETDTTAGILEILNRYVTNSLAAVPGYAAQEASANAPTGTDQKVEATVTSSEEGASTYVRIGVGGETVPSSQEWDDRGRMAFLELAYAANGVRTLSLKHRVGSATSETTLATLTMVAAGAVKQEGYYGELIDDGALNTLQHLRFIVTAQDYGLKLQGYVNNLDDDHPTIEAELRSDYDVGPGFTETFGYWWFELSPTNTANALVLTDFSAEDYTITDRVAVSKREYYPRVDEVLSRVKRRFASSNQDFDDFELIEMIADETEQIILAMGDEAWFLIIQETLSLSTDSDGFATLPSYVERALYIERSGTFSPASWAFSHHDSNGDLVIRLDIAREPSTNNFRVRYIQRWIRPQFPADRLPIPKQHIETVVYATCRTLAAIKERSPTLEQSFERLYQQRLLAMHKEKCRHTNQMRIRMQPRRRAQPPPFGVRNPAFRRF